MLNATITATELARAIPYKRFETALSIRLDAVASKALGKDHWRVVDTFKFYTGSEDNPVWAVVPAGFLTDGASVPKFLWWLLPQWGIYGRAAALHDYLLEYGQLYHRGQQVTCSRRRADRIFREAMQIEHVARWKYELMYAAVRVWSIFGKRKKAAYKGLKRELDADWEFSEEPVLA